MSEQTETLRDELEGVNPGDPFADEDGTTLPPEGAGEDDIPTVDREGNRVEPRADAPVPDEPVATEAVPEPEPESAREPEAVEEEPPAPAPAPQEPPVAAQEGEDGGEAAQDEPDKPKGEQRAYEALMQTGPNQWTEIPLSGHPNTSVVDGKTYLMARNADHARRQLWPIIGRPADGATIVAVAKSSWSPKRIRPRTVPAREALEIS